MSVEGESADASTGAAWSSAELAAIAAARELDIAVPADDGTPRAGMPIWVVTVGERVYIRSWHRRATGWFGRAVRGGRARIRVPGLESEVRVRDAPHSASDAEVSSAYRAKYGRAGASSMTTPEAEASTLELTRIEPTPPAVTP